MDSIHLVLIPRVAPDVNIPMTEVMTWRGLVSRISPPAGELATVQDVDEIRHY